MRMIIFIASELRSGSTLLDHLLSNHKDAFTVGELSNLEYYLAKSNVGPGTTRNWICRCGEDFSSCEFWSSIAKRYRSNSGQRLKEISSCAKVYPRNFKLISKMPIEFVYRQRNLHEGLLAYNNLYSANTDSAQNIVELYSHIFEKTGQKIIVDSSKKPEQLYAIKNALPNDIDLRVIHIVRDGRAVAYSTCKRALESNKEVSFSKAAIRWAITNLLIRNLEQYFKANEFIRIKHEDLCENTEKTIADICGKFEIEYDQGMAEISSSNNHNVGGTPRDFREGTKIQLDERWKRKIKLKDRILFLVVAWIPNKIFGY